MSCLSRHGVIFCPGLTNVIVLEPQLKSACACVYFIPYTVKNIDTQKYSVLYREILGSKEQKRVKGSTVVFC